MQRAGATTDRDLVQPVAHFFLIFVCFAELPLQESTSVTKWNAKWDAA
jgi:hypothetical protein